MRSMTEGPGAMNCRRRISSIKAGDRRGPRGGEGHGQHPVQQFAPLRPFRRGEAKEPTQVIELLVAGLEPRRIGGESAGIHVELAGQVIQSGGRDGFPRTQ
jgi:hypothetical protein